jgi:hypothetical protein
MTIACLVAGASMFGFVLPELITQWGTQLRVPALQNFTAAFAFGLIAYGLRG